MIQFRTADSNDLPSINELLLSSDLSIEDVAVHINNFVVAVHEHKIIGVAGYENYFPHAFIRSVAVTQAMRNKHIGKQLINLLIENCSRQNFTTCYLLTETAVVFFSNIGFSPIERATAPEVIKQTHEYQHICKSTATLMQKNIN